MIGCFCITNLLSIPIMAKIWHHDPKIISIFTVVSFFGNLNPLSTSMPKNSTINRSLMWIHFPRTPTHIQLRSVCVDPFNASVLLSSPDSREQPTSWFWWTMRSLRCLNTNTTACMMLICCVIVLLLLHNNMCKLCVFRWLMIHVSSIRLVQLSSLTVRFQFTSHSVIESPAHNISIRCLLAGKANVTKTIGTGSITGNAPTQT